MKWLKFSPLKVIFEATTFIKKYGVDNRRTVELFQKETLCLHLSGSNKKNMEVFLCKISIERCFTEIITH